MLFVFLFFPKNILAQTSPKDEVFEATITDVTESGTIIEEDGFTHPYQKLELIGTSGAFKGKKISLENGGYNQTGVVTYKKGDKVILNSTKSPDGKSIIVITDYVRRLPLLVLALIFVLLTIAIGGLRGANSILGMIITFLVLFLFVLPRLIAGANPLITTGVASIFLIPVTFLLSHGINRKTWCAILGTFIALIIAGFLSIIFVDQAHLTGFASEEAGFLDVMKKGTLDIKGLLFAGIVIALLGILEDITISQSAIVFQLKKANKKLGAVELFKSAMNVGKDHIASMANTLILVYAGASLPLLLLFINNPLPYSYVINNEVIAEEIVRTLVASIALVLAVPITTAIASLSVLKEEYSSN